MTPVIIESLNAIIVNDNEIGSASPLWMAANNGDTKTIHSLIELEGYLPEYPSQDGTTAAEIAYGHGYMDIYGLLNCKGPLIIGLTTKPLNDLDLYVLFNSILSQLKVNAFVRRPPPAHQPRENDRQHLTVLLPIGMHCSQTLFTDSSSRLSTKTPKTSGHTTRRLSRSSSRSSCSKGISSTCSILSIRCSSCRAWRRPEAHGQLTMTSPWNVAIKGKGVFTGTNPTGQKIGFVFLFHVGLLRKVEQNLALLLAL